MDISNRSTTKRKKNQTPETKFHLELTFCSKKKDLNGAVALYETALFQKTRLNQHHFNTLLYLCSNSVTDSSLKEISLQYGFRIFDHMISINVAPNEATITAVARLAAAKMDGDYAFDLVKSMGKYSATPRLRTYDPALFCFCEKLEVDKAYEVETHMETMRISLEEPELNALLKASSEKGKGEKVYEYLHKMRSSLRCVGDSTAKSIEEWFCSSKGCEVEEINFDEGLIKKTVLRNGGGWHGKGWIGKGNWVVKRGNVGPSGECCSCGEKLVCVDIDCDDTERFAQSVAALAMEREVQTNFSVFQDWLDKHTQYEAVVDGANIGLYQQNFADGGFSVSQLDAVVRELYNRSGKKWPLVVLHNKRVRPLMDNPSHRKIVEEWIDKGVLYTTPNGSNDDWYWLYAAVKLKCLLVTNDEMRDHIFELLGSSFFLKWKERHQVHYTFVKGNLKLEMPPQYSLIIQESERGSWHIPIAGECPKESARTWLCITRPSGSPLDQASVNHDNSGKGHTFNGCNGSLYSCSSAGSVRCSDEIKDCWSPVSDNKDRATTGKRKERPLSPS